MYEDEVTPPGPITPVVPPAGQGKDEVTTLKSQLEASQRELTESRQSERFWADRARSNGSRAAAEPEPEELPNPDDFMDGNEPTGLEGDTAAKFVDDLAAQGAAALAKRGYVTADVAKRMAIEAATKVSREMIDGERAKMSTDQRLMDEFPELKNKNSELFKETAKLYQDAVAFDPGAMKTPAALYLAAKSAKAALARSTPARDDESGDDGREPEVDRRHRAASQDGRAKAPKVDDGMELLGDEAKRLVKEFGITDDEFRKSRQEMGVGSRRGRR